MALSVGVDLIELDRVRRIVDRHGERFLTRVCTPAEMALCRDRLPELAARFAAKEAVSKALGVGLRYMSAEGIGFHEIEVLPDGRGKPILALYGRARELAEEQGLREWSISLSHSRDQAVAFVVASSG
jgi:holo-[acyl-carrier protein] synthase